MKLNYNWMALLCMGLSVPLVYHLATRGERGGGPSVRFASYNLALNRGAAGGLLAELRGGGSASAKKLAEVIQRANVDVVLLNELDWDEAGEAAKVFAEEYLAVSQGGQDPLDFTYRFTAPVNTGVSSGKDLDGDGAVAGPQDAYGYGRFPGQYGMALLSRYPILEDQARTFQTLKWSAMPGALRPRGYYPDDVWRHLRLSSKSHWDVPIGVGMREDGFVVHALCSHPTPPSFDGEEDRNGCRNHDEIRFWVDYLTPDNAGWINDDQGVAGGLAEGASFVLLGDLNCDPVDGESRREALRGLLSHPRVQDPEPRGPGGAEQKLKQFGVNMRHQGDPAMDTGDFGDEPGKGPGNLRVDYALPSRDLVVGGAAVVWPRSYEQTLPLVEASDHRLVWVDVAGR
ncbi:MAG: endonuclease/exonuclease/phosphatase family protein [Planctomycetota bacterium]|nr:endonuclease/exonuclease/phosphatase family protein [Planctomycetota bacterium]